MSNLRKSQSDTVCVADALVAVQRRTTNEKYEVYIITIRMAQQLLTVLRSECTNMIVHASVVD